VKKKSFNRFEPDNSSRLNPLQRKFMKSLFIVAFVMVLYVVNLYL